MTISDLLGLLLTQSGSKVSVQVKLDGGDRLGEVTGVAMDYASDGDGTKPYLDSCTLIIRTNGGER